MSRNKPFSIISFGFIILAILLSFFPAAQTQAAGPSVFINEIHYDNSGDDAGEAVEIAGPAGTDLTGWSLILYNGNGGAVYDTVGLGGIIPDQDNGFGTLSFLTPAIQNGGPDGLALVNDGGTAVQLLSYEGSFTAVGGPADGLTSEDIGVNEGSSTAAGDSLQLTGTGTEYGDFSWAGAQPNTFDAVNTGQSFGEAPPPTPTPPPPSDTAPIVSSTSPADAAVNVPLNSNLEISFDEPVDVSGAWYEISCDSSGPHTAAVSGGPTAYVLDPEADFAYNENCTVSLTASLITDQDSDDPPDAMVADFSFSFTTNSSTPVADHMIINEVDADTPGTDVAEFVELYDGGSGNTDLSGLVLVFFNGSDDASYQAYDLDGMSTDGAGYFVLCGDGANVANCDMDVSPDSNLVQNGADAVALLIGDAVDFPTDTPLTTNGLLDAIVYDTNDGDDAGLLPLLNAGQPQVNEGGAGDKDNHSNQRCSNGAGGQRNTDTYTQFEPTPGATNCVAPLPDIIINEVDADTPGNDALEFIELYDGGVGNTGLDGLVVVLYNGSDDQSYTPAFDLDGYSTDANGYFVIGTIDGADFYVAPTTYGWLQNGADAVALLVGDASDYPNDTPINTTDLIDAIVYDTYDNDDTGLLILINAGQPQVNEGENGDKDNHSNQRCPDGTGGPRNTDTYAQFGPSPGAENTCGAAPAEACGDLFTPIYAIQGSGVVSPLVGTEVATEGIVVGDFQNNGSIDNGDLNGFHIQDPTGDGDVATSDGVFVYAPSGMDVSIGDAVRVRGYVSEYYDLTEISASQIWICSSGNELSATPISLPVSNTGDLEAYEGMLVNFVQPLYISEYYNFARYGEIVLSTERQFQPTATYDPGSPEAADLAADNLLARIKLDDGRSSQNPDPALHPNGAIFEMTNLFRGGDILNNLTGVVDYSYGEYKIQPTQGADYVSANPRTSAPENVGGSLKVASFNVLNYFTTLDDGTNDICGPAHDLECRGADTDEEFARQRAKIISALAAIDADVVGLIEIENNEFEAVADLVDGLNAVVPGTYAYVDTGYIGSDAIKVAFIYKIDTVSLVGDYAILDSSVDPTFIDTKNRPSLAQTFMDNATGGVFTAVVNHFKSKGSSCGSIGDPDLGDGAGNCNLTRTAAAEALVDWLATDPTGSGDADFMIIGDLNSYDKEDPIDAIIGGGYSDLVYSFIGENAYSYVFDGQLGYLDHALAFSNLTLKGEISGTTVWHINADEPSLIDYDMSYKKPAQDALYAADPYRSSDHDPVIIGLEVCDDIAPALDIQLSTDTLWPANHKLVEITATVTASDNFDLDPTVTLLSIVSSEKDEDIGDGNTEDDIVILDNYTFQLRAERSGKNKDGRFYLVTYQVEDACGNTTLGFATVTVPFSQKKK